MTNGSGGTNQQSNTSVQQNRPAPVQKLSKGDLNRIKAWGALWFIIAIIIVVILYAAGVGSLVKSITTVSGVSIFAIFYLIAQFDERLVEPVSNSKQFGGHDNPDDPDQKQARAVALGFLASGIGIVLSYLTVGLLTTVGATFAVSTMNSHLLDAVITGIIVGSGTKPLHDVINLFDTSSSGKGKSNGSGSNDAGTSSAGN